MDARSLYVQLGRLVESIPDFQGKRPLAPATHQWLARLYALLVETGSQGEAQRLQSLTESLGLLASDGDVHKIHSILFRNLAIAEMKTPAPAQGAFIPVGNEFDALAAIGDVLKSATKDLLIVDPYLDHKVLTDFALQTVEGVSIRLLTDEKLHKATLKPAVQRWVAQYKAARPLAVRLSPFHALHDRLIIVDNSEVRVLTQSLNAFAVRSPASIIRVDEEMASLKIPAYRLLWDAASPL